MRDDWMDYSDFGNYHSSAPTHSSIPKIICTQFDHSCTVNTHNRYIPNTDPNVTLSSSIDHVKRHINTAVIIHNIKYIIIVRQDNTHGLIVSEKSKHGELHFNITVQLILGPSNKLSIILKYTGLESTQL